MKKRENKNDKIIIFFVCFLAFAILSWVLGATYYQSGELVNVGWYRAGLYDLVAMLLSGLTYKIEDLIYILFVGGMYGILVKTESYKKIVNKLANVIKGKEVFAFAIITFIIGLYTSISNNILTLFFLVPFVMSVFLKSGQDKLTAFGAGFGGLFLGYLGQTFSIFANTNTVSGTTTSFLYDHLEVGPFDMIWTKLVIFLIAYVLFNVFAALHMKKKNKEVINYNEADPFAVGEVIEPTNKSAKVKTWPTIVASIIALLVIMLGFISWNESFGVTLFDKVYTAVMDFSIGNIRIMETLFGTNMTAFGTWYNLLPAVFVLLFILLVVVITNKVSFSDVANGFGEGAKKMLKVAGMYGLSYAFLYMMTSFPWPTSVVDMFIPTESFNIVLLLISGLLAVFFSVDPSYAGYYFGQRLAAVYSSKLVEIAVVWRLGGAIALLLVPTSFLLLTALTYADISYKNWLKYIWKFALVFTIAVLILMAVVVYV